MYAEAKSATPISARRYLSNDTPGGYAEYMRLTEALMMEVPNGLAPQHAALTEPMAVGLHAVEMARLDRNDVPLVIGCGPVGLAVIAAGRLGNERLTFSVAVVAAALASPALYLGTLGIAAAAAAPWLAEGDTVRARLRMRTT